LGAYRLEPDDVLLGALALALREWLGKEEFVLNLEGHGREELQEVSVDLSRVVGWFTSVYPVRLEARDEAMGDHLLRLKEMLRVVPSKGLGYGALFELGAVDKAQRSLLAADPAFVFNYLGSFDQGLQQGQSRASTYQTGPSMGGTLPVSHALALNASVWQGRFILAATVDLRRCSSEEAKRFLGLYQQCLQEVAAHCLAQAKTPRYSPSDFGLV
jgi:non-ribosomal peptide synthase protein (TIGR01720 family)